LSHSRLVLDGALVGAVSARATHVAVVLPRIPVSRARARADETIPVVEVEIRLWHGEVLETVPRLPRRLARWAIHHRGGVMTSAPESDFQTSGDVRLEIEFAPDERIVLTGTRLTIRVAKRVAQLAPPRRRSFRPARQPKRHLPRSV
jgi:hypothetical protein